MDGLKPLFALSILLAVLAQPCLTQDCYHPTGNCSWYPDCLQVAYPNCTGKDSYALSYGLYFCDRFNKHLDWFTPEGQVWIQKVAVCLQVALVPYLNSTATPLTCDEVKTIAFSTHTPCYVGCGFCSLTLKDYFGVVRVVAPALLTEFGETVRGLLQVLWQCVTGGGIANIASSGSCPQGL